MPAASTASISRPHTCPSQASGLSVVRRRNSVTSSSRKPCCFVRSLSTKNRSGSPQVDPSLARTSGLRRSAATSRHACTIPALQPDDRVIAPGTVRGVRVDCEFEVGGGAAARAASAPVSFFCWLFSIRMQACANRGAARHPAGLSQRRAFSSIRRLCRPILRPGSPSSDLVLR